MNKNQKIVVGGTALLLALGMGVAAVGSTSAYFSDTNSGGAITVTAGNVYVDTDGHETATSDLEYTNVLPGDEVSKDVTVQNSGTSAQDVYLVVDAADLAAAKEAIAGKGDVIITVGGVEVASLSTMDTETLLFSDLQPTDGPATVTFTMQTETGTQTATEVGLNLPYSIVATQPGVTPGA